jgi:fused signal recognition particle receptor
MVFDWFRRKFDQTATPAAEDQVAPDAPAEQPSSEPEETETVPDAAEDYLAWAKAAYQNLKQQQGENSEFGIRNSESGTSNLLRAASPLEKPQAPNPELQTPNLEPQSPNPEPQSPNPELHSHSVSERETPDSEPPIPNSEFRIPNSLTFLERAEAARQSRLEQLKATALEEPEPEAKSEPKPTSVEALLAARSRLTFDEEFLWSAEVLAAEGRKPEEVSIEEIDWLRQLREGLGKTRRNLVNQLKSIVGQGPLNQEAVMEIEALLLQADVGVEATDYVIAALQDKLREESLPSEEAISYLKSILRTMLDRPLEKAATPILAPEHDTLNIWLLTGVNGAGKTTTIGKLAHLGKKSGYRCLIAAADTFRAAAVQQVQTWGERSEVEVIANPGKNTDPAAVVFDAIAAARSRNTELLLVDTAGRLQNKKNLMAELSKIRRIIDKNAVNARVESLLVLDATLGQNGVRQAEVFSEAASLSGVVLTKLDGSARGGVALAVVQQLGLPIRFIGAGEGIADLRPFSSHEFVEALLSS